MRGKINSYWNSERINSFYEAELVKHIDTLLRMDFMMVSSYHGGTASSGVINIQADVTQDIKGRHVLL